MRKYLPWLATFVGIILTLIFYPWHAEFIHQFAEVAIAITVGFVFYHVTNILLHRMK